MLGNRKFSYGVMMGKLVCWGTGGVNCCVVVEKLVMLRSGWC